MLYMISNVYTSDTAIHIDRNHIYIIHDFIQYFCYQTYND